MTDPEIDFAEAYTDEPETQKTVVPEVVSQPKPEKRGRGRPTVIDEGVLAKIIEAKAYGANNDEACIVAEINPATLYRYMEKHPEFSERLSRVGNVLVIQAHKRIGLELQRLEYKDAIDLAKWVIGQHKDKIDTVPQLTASPIGTTVQVNIGNQITPEEANDLTDDELALVASREKTLAQVLADRKKEKPAS